MAHEKPARRLVDQRGRRSRTLYRKLNKCKCRVLYWLEKVLKMISLYVNARLCTLQHIFIHAMQLCGVNSPNLHLHLQLFNFLYTVRDLRPRWSTRRRAGFSCATLYYVLLKPLNINVIIPTIHIIVSFMGYITHVCTLHKRCKTLITKSEY